MAFKRHFDDPAYIQQQKKRLSYTITNIGGLDEWKEWKARQAQKEKEWQAKEKARFEMAAEGLYDGSLAAKDASGSFGESETTRVYRRYQEGQEKQKKAGRIASAASSIIEDHNALLTRLKDDEPSMLARIYEWCLDKFLSIKL
jgi:hypothetical protein